MLPADQSPVLVFDLDGTILRVNSFPLWALFLLGGWLPNVNMRRRLALSLRTQALLIQRKLDGIDHDELLRRLQHAWQSAIEPQQPVVMVSRFEAALMRRVRPNLASVLKLIKSGRMDAILATAAAADYAENIGWRLGFRDVLATPAGRHPNEGSNSGTRKRDGVLALLRVKGWHDRKLILFTDHIDDLPLIRESKGVFWFGPETAMTHAAACADRVPFTFCRNLSTDAVYGALQSFLDCRSENPE